MLAAGQTHYEKQISCCYKDERKYDWGDLLGGMILWADSDAEWILNWGEKLAALTSEAKRGPGQRVRHWGSRHSPWCSGRDHRASIYNIELFATRITQALSSSSWHKVSTCFLEWPRPWLSTEVVRPAGLRAGPGPRSLHLLGILGTTWHTSLTQFLNFAVFKEECRKPWVSPSHSSLQLYHLFSSPYFFQRKE